MQTRILRVVLTLGLVLGVLGAAYSPMSGAAAPASGAPQAQKVLFFTADGMRQDLVDKYAAQGKLMGLGEAYKLSVKAADNGLLTEAPPNTGAGWYSLATGAWPAVTGSTNNTFHINGKPFATRTGSFDSGVLQAETIAQSAE